MLITLLSEGIQISYLVQMFLEVFVISFIFCCYGYNVTMETEAMYLYHLLFEGIGTLSLVHIHFEATAVPGIICC